MHISFASSLLLSLAATTTLAQQSVITINVQGAGTVPAGAPPAIMTTTALGAPEASPVPGQQGAGAAGAPAGAKNGEDVWVVKVGSPNNDLIFSPNTVMATPGQFVQFQFYAKVRIPNDPNI